MLMRPICYEETEPSYAHQYILNDFIRESFINIVTSGKLSEIKSEEDTNKDEYKLIKILPYEEALNDYSFEPFNDRILVKRSVKCSFENEFETPYNISKELASKSIEALEKKQPFVCESTIYGLQIKMCRFKKNTYNCSFYVRTSYEEILKAKKSFQ